MNLDLVSKNKKLIWISYLSRRSACFFEIVFTRRLAVIINREGEIKQYEDMRGEEDKN